MSCHLTIFAGFSPHSSAALNVVVVHPMAKVAVIVGAASKHDQDREIQR